MDRKLYIVRRKHLPLEERMEKEARIAKAVRPYLHGQVAAYRPIQGEVDLLSCFDSNTAFPRVMDDKTIQFFLDTGTYDQGSFGIEEPEAKLFVDPTKIDVIIVPVVAFSGVYRLGHGKGYYDRFLANCPALKIGVAFDCQEDGSLVFFDHDMPMDLMITESRIIERK